jgi:hypothetical protein
VICEFILRHHNLQIISVYQNHVRYTVHIHNKPLNIIIWEDFSGKYNSTANPIADTSIVNDQLFSGLNSCSLVANTLARTADIRNLVSVSPHGL